MQERSDAVPREWSWIGQRRHYILNADGQLGLEVVEVLCQLVAVVIVGEEALEERQQLEASQKRREKNRVKLAGTRAAG